MVHSARLPQWPTDLTLSPDGTRLFLVNLGSTRLLEVDALSGEQTRAVEIGTGSSAVARTRTGSASTWPTRALASCRKWTSTRGRWAT